MINTGMDRKNLYSRLVRLNLIKKIRPLLGKGGIYEARVEDGKFVPQTPTKAIASSWLSVSPAPDMRCDIYHYVLWDQMRIVPSRCRECYKVVVKPKTVVDLFNIYEIQKALETPSKCGIERRPTTSSLYGAYFYSKGLEKGFKKYKEVRKLADKFLSPRTDVILKRYCTEFEIGPGSKGPSDQLPEMTEEEKWWEEQVLLNFPRVGIEFNPDYIIANTMVEWIHHAHRYGDKSYLELTDGRPLVNPYVTYHDKVEEK